MRVLVACEFSGRVRDAFIQRGHDAVSCDLEPSDTPGPHYRCDVRALLGEHWDLLVGFPPCTHLCTSGARWFHRKKKEQEEAVAFFLTLWNCGIPRIALENPVGVMSTRLGKPSQIVQPWMFGHGETKATCLWLKNVQPLTPTNIVDGRQSRVHWMGESKARSKKRSLTYLGIAAAMAEQWG